MRFAASFVSVMCLAVVWLPLSVWGAPPQKDVQAWVVVVPDDTPLGDAANDTRTSAAVTAILQACADAYTSAPVFFGEGRYLISQKLGEKSESESYTLMVNFHRPDKLRVEISEKNDETLFLADGTTITMNWPKVKEYKQIPQPRELAAFVEQERSGVLLEDDTQSVLRSTAPALLVSDDPLDWIHGNVEKYFFEGSETVAGADTWRIKFVQSKGSTIIMLWVDKRTGFLRKTSGMIASDESGYSVDSYADAYKAFIIISIFERISTRASTVPKSRFRLGRIPENWKNLSNEDDAELEEQTADGTSLFSKFFRAAAEETATTPTTTIESDTDTSSLLRILWKHDLPQRASTVALDGSGSGNLHVVTQNKQVIVLDRDGHEARPYRLAQPVSKAALSADGKMLFTIAKNKRSVQAYDCEDGSFKWATTLQGTLETLISPPSKNGLMVGGSKGIFLLSSEGELVFSSRRVTEVTQLLSDPAAEENVIVTSDDDGLTLFSAGGHWLEELSATALYARICSIMDENKRTYFALNEGEAGDVALQRLDSKGRPTWTVGVAAPARDLSATAVTTANFRLPNDSVTTASTGVVITQMNDGRISVVSQEGKPIWRGRIKTNDPLFMASPDDGVIASYATDLNGDGSDEVVVVLPRSVVALTVNQ